MSTINTPSIPHKAGLPEPLKNGTLIRVTGTPNSNAKSFGVSFLVGSDPQKDVAFKLMPDFKSGRVIRNSMKNKKWGKEETGGPSFPFSTGKGFELLILVENDRFKIAVNGSYFGDFEHKFSISEVTHYAIDGDVSIDQIKFEPPVPSQPSSGPDITRPIGFVLPSTPDAAGVSYGAPGYPGYPAGVPAAPYGGMLPAQVGYSPYGGMAAPYPVMGGMPGPETTVYTPEQHKSSDNSGLAAGLTALATGVGGAMLANKYGKHGHAPNPATALMSGGPASMIGGLMGHKEPAYAPGQHKSSDSSGLAAGFSALATGVGGAMLANKYGKQGHALNPATALMSGGPASMIGGLMGSKHKPKSSSSIGGMPIPGAVLGGAAALAGAYALSKTPVGKVMKPKKMKKLYKHKHKGKHFGWSSSSSSSSSSEEE